MNESHEPNRDPVSDEQLENYLDGMYSGPELEQFDARLKNDARAQKIVAKQQDFDARLKRSFTPPNKSASEIEKWLDAPVATPAANATSRRPLMVGLAVLAAVITWLLVGIQWNGDRHIEPFFEQRSLATLYHESVEQGFRPYYFCEDEERFALTFKKRQDVTLKLDVMPDDRRMVGLSYLGGLSRDTTAMLCYVDEQPVVVFVDRNQFDNKELATSSDDTGLHVYRSELKGLVLYEVSPLESPKLMEYLRVDQ